MTIEQIKKIPKVELHVHLDGSVNIELASKLSNQNIEILKTKMIAYDTNNLNEYLEKFKLPVSLMQTKENLSLISEYLANDLKNDNVIYAEIRFAPSLHTKEGLSYEEIIDSVLDGLNKVNTIKTNLILCLMRGASYEENLKTIEVAYKYLNNGVVGIDLAGAEDKYPIDEYLELFEIAKAKNIPFTIHAGENRDYKEIEKAINVGASRIGHGIHAIDSIKTQNLIKEKDILLEICPTSNVQTNSVDIYSNHPINYFYNNGIKVCINTDNKTVSNISLTEEYIKLYSTFNFTLNDFKNMNKNAVDKAFLNDKDKDILRKKLIN